ncbi:MULTISPECIES: general secretion pathway protein GspK [Leptospira]|uniref:general secretion pathway protein GspK n=1 Tax=Leptospira TaxID=171 RepID=UPI000278493D|nr:MULTISPECIES: type II secretion system protein GspK [Leptospira]EJO70432.1 type II secretion system protein K-like protein [Leptospira kirschneri serovar Grippotyphosa str. RM52]EMK03417.1 type II secretion system protein K-like protein [Leptospira kirschneri]EMK06609.1 type II secretion system protein K-like protein [Leptospira kirschneri str. MMD1493]EMN27210.1 type II secretion system protein K-like protein [Leptospira kirschneri serovar Sokoine str. RM1]KXZ25603.1 type II secretion prot
MKLLRFREFFLSNIQILLKTKPKISKEIITGKFLTKCKSSHKFEVVSRFLIGFHHFVRLQIFRFYNWLCEFPQFQFLERILNWVQKNFTFKTKENSWRILYSYQFRKSREGFMVVILVMAIGTASFYTATEFGERSLGERRIAQADADGFRALLLAKAGFQGALGALKKIPEEYLYKSGIALNPPPLPLGGGTIYYKISSEDGKINLNSLLNQDDNQQNLRSVEMLSRLFDHFGIKREKIFPIFDWMDTDLQETGGGAEDGYYSSLKPPRKNKNSFMYSISELVSVKGFDRATVYGSLKPADFDQKYSKAFQSEEERALIGDSDFVLANNVTAYIPSGQNSDDRINLNGAPYFVLMSLSDFMTKQAAMRILKFKLEQGGFIKELKDLEKFQEFQIPTSGGLTLYKELAGEGTEVSGGRVKTKGEIFRIVAVGQVGKTIRRITGIFDLTNNQMLYYMED